MDVGRDAPSDTDNGESFSGEEGVHRAQKFMLCSFAHFACSPLLQAFLHKEEMCNVASTCCTSVGNGLKFVP